MNAPPSGPAKHDTAPPGPAVSGLAQGGLGGPEDELLEAGQEEVFSRTEVETGRIEHNTDTQASPLPGGVRPASPKPEKGNPHG